MTLVDPPSTFTGIQLSVAEMCDAAYRAGFRTEATLLAAVSICVSESSLWTQARNWHIEYGYRPSTDVIGVQGPTGAWNAGHTQQLHSDRGVWQISSHSWPQYNDAVCDDRSLASDAAWVISSSGANFSPWDTYASGVAQSHYDASVGGWPALRPPVQAYLASPPSLSRTFTGKAGTSSSSKVGNVLRVGGVPIGPGPGHTPGVQNLAGKLPVAVNLKGARMARRRPVTGKAAASASAKATSTANQVDLVVTTFSANLPNPTAGQAVTFSVTVQNASGTPLPAGRGDGQNVGVGIYLDGTAANNIITYTNWDQGLAAGASFTLDTVSGWAPGGAWIATQGTHTLTAWVDDANKIAESNNANNTRTLSLTVGAGAPPPTGGARLFSNTSAWNTVKSPTQFSYMANADALLSSQTYGINNGPGFFTPCYFGAAGDPVQTFHIGAGWGWPARTVQGRAPAGMISPSGGDGSMAVVFAPGTFFDPNRPTADGLDMYQARDQGNNVWNVAMAVPFDSVNGFGFAQPDKGDNASQGVCAIGCCEAGGSILKQDILAGHINHAVRIAFNYDAMGGVNGTQVGYAISNDVGPPGHGGDFGAPIPEGALLMPVGAEPPGLSYWGHEFWLACVTYGVWVSDRLDGPPLFFGDGTPECIAAFGHYGDVLGADMTAVGRKLRLTTVGFTYPMPW